MSHQKGFCEVALMEWMDWEWEDQELDGDSQVLSLST